MNKNPGVANSGKSKKKNNEVKSMTKTERLSKKKPTSNTLSLKPENKEREALKKAHRHRMVFLMKLMINSNVEVTLPNGNVIAGLLHSVDPSSFEIAILYARVKKGKAEENFKTGQTIFLKNDEFIELRTPPLPLYHDAPSTAKENKFLTDHQISGLVHSTLVGRSLERADSWLDPSLKEESAFDDKQISGSWNQFEVNQKLFNVQNTFDENLYTTRLDRGKITEEMEHKAVKLAMEISGEVSSNYHMMEERGYYSPSNKNKTKTLDLKETPIDDEEAKYSSVARKPPVSFENSEKQPTTTRVKTMAEVLKEKKAKEQTGIAATVVKEPPNRDKFPNQDPNSTGINHKESPKQKDETGSQIAQPKKQSDSNGYAKDLKQEKTNEVHEEFSWRKRVVGASGTAKETQAPSQDVTNKDGDKHHLDGDQEPVNKSGNGAVKTFSDSISVKKASETDKDEEEKDHAGDDAVTKNKKLNPNAKEFVFQCPSTSTKPHVRSSASKSTMGGQNYAGRKSYRNNKNVSNSSFFPRVSNVYPNMNVPYPLMYSPGAPENWYSPYEYQYIMPQGAPMQPGYGMPCPIPNMSQGSYPLPQAGGQYFQPPPIYSPPPNSENNYPLPMPPSDMQSSYSSLQVNQNESCENIVEKSSNGQSDITANDKQSSSVKK